MEDIQKTEQLAAQGDVAAMVDLAEYYYDPWQGDDLLLAIEWSTKAAEQGDAMAQYKTGLYTLEYEGPDAVDKATKWFQISANQGIPEAQFEIACHYFNGHTYKRDNSKGFEWAMKSANQGYLKAILCVASCYEDGCGTKQNEEEALHWYDKAVELGDGMARLKIKAIKFGRHYVEDDEFIEVKQDTPRSEWPESICAYSFAEPGAMGVGGRVLIMDKEGKLFYFNIYDMEVENIYDEETGDEIENLWLELQYGISYGPFSNFDLGYGNHLYVSVEYADDFEICASTCTEPGQLYQSWQGMMRFLISINDEDELESEYIGGNEPSEDFSDLKRNE